MTTVFTLEHIALGIALANPAAAKTLMDNLEQMSWHDESVGNILAGIKTKDPGPIRAWIAKHQLAKGQPVASILQALVTYGKAKKRRETAQALLDASKLMDAREFLKEWDRVMAGV